MFAQQPANLIDVFFSVPVDKYRMSTVASSVCPSSRNIVGHPVIFQSMSYNLINVRYVRISIGVMMVWG